MSSTGLDGGMPSPDEFDPRKKQHPDTARMVQKELAEKFALPMQPIVDDLARFLALHNLTEFNLMADNGMSFHLCDAGGGDFDMEFITRMFGGMPGVSILPIGSGRRPGIRPKAPAPDLVEGIYQILKEHYPTPIIETLGVKHDKNRVVADAIAVIMTAARKRDHDAMIIELRTLIEKLSK